MYKETLDKANAYVMNTESEYLVELLKQMSSAMNQREKDKFMSLIRRERERLLVSRVDEEEMIIKRLDRK